MTSANGTSSPLKVRLRDIEQLVKCNACHLGLILPPVYSCRRGHNECASCLAVTGKYCSVCKEPLSGRNLVMEEVIHELQGPLMSAGEPTPMDLINLGDGSKDMKDKAPSKAAAAKRQDAAKYLTNLIDEECFAQMLTSGRTVPCPFSCGTRVTSSGLYRHFGFQHPEVFVEMLRKNHPFPIHIPHEEIALLGEQCPYRCIYFIVVAIGDQEDQEDTMNAAELLSMTHSMRYMLRCRRYIALLSVSRLPELEVLAVWITGLYDFSPVHYTLRYNNGPDTVSYQGRPKSLYDQVETRGGCLLLPYGLLKDADPESTSLELTVIFHLELPFPLVHTEVAGETQTCGNVIDV